MIELCSKLDCTGCASCINICPKGCISMEESFEGFFYPQINNTKCVKCGLCQKSCPILSPVVIEQKPLVYVAWNLDNQVRCTSSSGGVFYTLAEYIIKNKGVVFGTIYDKDMNIYHTYSETISGLLPMKGSKYAQSNIGQSYKLALTFLKQDRYVLFTGTPCQIAGLKAFLNNKVYPKLLLVDIVCHGVPSGKVFKYYLDKLAEKIGKFDKSSFLFRNLDGWGYSPTIKIADIKRILSPIENIYMGLFLKGMLHRESCYNCNFAHTPRISDITIGDFWGIGRNKPFNHDCTKGCSLILINNSKGETTLSLIKSKLFIQERELSEAIVFNKQLYSPDSRNKNRDNSYKYIFSNSINAIDKKYLSNPYIRARRLIRKILNKIA